MIPLKTIEELISKHSLLEKELSAGDVDKKLFAEKSKEYSDLNEIIDDAKKYFSYDNEKMDLEKILEDPGSDNDFKSMAQSELNNLKSENELKEKILSEDIITRVVSEVEKKASELDKKKNDS